MARFYDAASMQPQLALYIASVVGAAALFLLMPKPGKDLRILGGVLGTAALGLLWLVLVPFFGDGGAGLDLGAVPFYYVFSALAIGSAVRVITHTRPVYAALWFVMVVIASSGLLLTLTAEFMAFAMLIIYGGAILVTYMFVIMLATPPRNSSLPETAPDYERFAAEPLWASMSGFLLLAVLLSAAFRPIDPNPEAMAVSDEVVIETTLAGRSTGEHGELATPGGLVETAHGTEAALSNTERVGLDLFEAHPLAIELAGVILLLSLIGAIVIAKTQVHNEDEVAAEVAEMEAAASG